VKIQLFANHKMPNQLRRCAEVIVRAGRAEDQWPQNTSIHLISSLAAEKMILSATRQLLPRWYPGS